ncbi:MAG: rRNA maturation RNase YbeY [Candidatus Liptonbacteria bacterium]|nr:rRNA maturation RNase YbeY [Candidatus Liptonbacteria bacterium]
MRRKNFQLEKKLRKVSENILKTVDLRKTVRKKADIFLLPHKEMLRLKKKFLPSEKGPPNVLAFPEPKHWPQPEKRGIKLGEIYLNLDLAKGDIRELSRLLIHGVLHLLGYHHKKKSDRMKMEKLEKNVIRKLGY